eukprot:755662-Hanusia_phi.AAC.1
MRGEERRREEREREREAGGSGGGESREKGREERSGGGQRQAAGGEETEKEGDGDPREGEGKGGEGGGRSTYRRCVKPVPQDEMKTETLQLEHTFPQNVAQVSAAQPPPNHRFFPSSTTTSISPSPLLASPLPSSAWRSLATSQNKETSEHSFIVGNCGVKGAGEFVLTDTKEAESLGFTFDQPAGKVDAGARVSILVKYSPPPSSPLSMWNEVTVSGALKGGDPPPPGGSLPFQLRLRGRAKPGPEELGGAQRQRGCNR